MNGTPAPDLASAIAARLKDEWAIGCASRFCDDQADWFDASTEEVAAVIREVMEGHRG